MFWNDSSIVMIFKRQSSGISLADFSWPGCPFCAKSTTSSTENYTFISWPLLLEINAVFLQSVLKSCGKTAGSHFVEVSRILNWQNFCSVCVDCTGGFFGEQYRAVKDVEHVDVHNEGLAICLLTKAMYAKVYFYFDSR